MRIIDYETWPRYTHFRKFIGFDHPHFSLCANVDLTEFVPYTKGHGFSFTLSILYLLTRTANAIPEFRYRIRPGMVVEHEIIHPSTTIMAGGDLFTFCTFEYCEDYSTFAEKAENQIAYTQAHPTLENIPDQDDQIYTSAIPWVSFTSFMHPMSLNPADSIPRLAWGKYFEEAGRIKMPLSVQGHHALMDGVHLGQYYARLQEYLDRPEKSLR
jgi:chloramphenicol O-acetyltransferase type A